MTTKHPNAKTHTACEEPPSNVLQTPTVAPEACLFCNPKPHHIIDQNEWGLTLTDSFPVVQGHSLIVPKRHAPTCFDLNAEEVLAIAELAQRARIRAMAQDPSVSGFNIGANAGPSAGQSVFHCHFHLFPRRDGDQENPRGGVRRIFPDKALYKHDDFSKP